MCVVFVVPAVQLVLAKAFRYSWDGVLIYSPFGYAFHSNYHPRLITVWYLLEQKLCSVVFHGYVGCLTAESPGAAVKSIRIPGFSPPGNKAMYKSHKRLLYRVAMVKRHGLLT